MARYNPVDGAWSFAEMEPLYNHTATQLSNGEVLVIGGVIDSQENRTDSVKSYNPDTGEWTELYHLPAPRSDHTATLVTDSSGKEGVLVTGGYDQDGNALNSALLYDPDNDEWSPLPEYRRSAGWPYSDDVIYQ